MSFTGRSIHVLAGPGRNVFEFFLAAKTGPSSRRGTEKRSIVKRVGTDAPQERIVEFSLTEDLFISEKYLVFTDYDDVKAEVRDLIHELYGKKEDLIATIFLPVRGKQKLKKAIQGNIDIEDVGEGSARSAAKSYMEMVFGEGGLDVSPQVIDFLTMSFLEDPISLISEVEKISVALQKEKEVTLETLKMVSDPPVEFKIFDILGELIQGDLSKGGTMLYRYFQVIEDSELLRALGAFQWVLKREFSRTRNRDRKKRLLKLLHLAFDMDLKIKGESRLPTRDIMLNSIPFVVHVLGTR